MCDVWLNHGLCLCAEFLAESAVVECAANSLSLLFWFYCRCSILSNATVKCDTGLYESLQAWKDHKLHIDHEVTHKEDTNALFDSQSNQAINYQTWSMLC